MVRLSNSLVGILNLVTFVLSIPILSAGIWLLKRASTECDKFFERPVIVLGVFLMLISLAGLIGACCRISWLLWLYLFVMFLLIVLLFCFTVFAFVVTNKGAGEALSGRGYKEYRLGNYSRWLQKRFNSTQNWNKIKSCLSDSTVCSNFQAMYASDTIEEFYTEHLSAFQSGCCKPSNDCNFTYVSPIVWNKPAVSVYSNPDCNTWDNDPKVLCYNCQSCKAGLVQNIKNDWKKVAVVNIIFLLFLVVVYSVGCCAFKNNREENRHRGQGALLK
ncbi:hypothetical protein BT93_C0165 [Corymbia citriodora subsp. variegata]|nr:hypothetical protein BT93_C0165 [Corymbia citriodora subsp. variegata]